MNPAYTLIMITAVATGFALARMSQRKLELATWQRIGIGAGAFFGAMIGAKIPFLFESWESFVDGSTWFGNGKTILTGLVGGYLGVELAKWSLDVEIKTGDSFVIPVAAAIAIGRLGCFQAGCCYGLPTNMPWAVVFDSVDLIPRHPTQIYEFAFHSIALATFTILQRHKIFVGNQIKLYIICYAGYRFLTEWLRPEAEIYYGLTGYQLGSLVIIGLFSWLWIQDSATVTPVKPNSDGQAADQS